MKTFLKACVASGIALLARAIIRKYRPQVVMVTGSVGKTSTKDALAAVLSERYFLRASEKSYNSEFGVPLTIIGSHNPWNNPSAWLRVFQEALALVMLPSHYPKLLVLEVGADSPGDLARILRIATPDLVIVTRMPDVPVHVEAYAGPQAVRDEEFAPAYALPEGAPLILSSDDPYASAMAKRLQTKVVTYGFTNADFTIANAHFFQEEGSYGMQADLVVQGIQRPMVVSGALGRPQLYAPAAAVAAACSLGMPLEEALASLSRYLPPPGRARILEGINGSLIVDDTYNSSPAAVEEALESLSLIPNRTRRIAILGDMLELGRYSMAEHERIGVLAAQKVNLLVAVGPRARAITEAAVRSGMQEEQTRFFGTSLEAAAQIPREIEAGDVILVKGSQSIRAERITEALLANPEDASKLARQEREWKQR